MTLAQALSHPYRLMLTFESLVKREASNQVGISAPLSFQGKCWKTLQCHYRPAFMMRHSIKAP